MTGYKYLAILSVACVLPFCAGYGAAIQQDILAQDSIEGRGSLNVNVLPEEFTLPDSVTTDALMSDSIAIDKVEQNDFLPMELVQDDLYKSLRDSLTARFAIDDSIPVLDSKLTTRQKDSIIMAGVDQKYHTDWTPVPRKATLLSMLIPGGGQIYNRKYWKLPIFYGGYVGCIYALSWNNQMYTDYMQAYEDIMDNDPDTKSYEDFLPPHYDIESNKEWLKDVLKSRKDNFRRYRDISIFCFAGVYLLSIIDAYVDAELSHFDVNKDLSLHWNPGILDTHTASLGLNLSLTF